MRPNFYNFIIKNKHMYLKTERSNEIIDLFQRQEIEFKDLEPLAKDNIRIALYAYRIDPNNIKYIWENLKKDANFIHKAIKWDIHQLIDISKYLDKNIIYNLVIYDINYIKLVSPKKMSNKEEVFKFIKNNPKTIKYIPKELCNIDFLKETININYKIYLYIDTKYKNNKELLKLTLNEIDNYRFLIDKDKDTWLYWAIPENLKNDSEIKAIINEKEDWGYLY